MKDIKIIWESECNDVKVIENILEEKHFVMRRCNLTKRAFKPVATFRSKKRAIGFAESKLVHVSMAISDSFLCLDKI